MKKHWTTLIGVSVLHSQRQHSSQKSGKRNKVQQEHVNVGTAAAMDVPRSGNDASIKLGQETGINMRILGCCSNCLNGCAVTEPSLLGRLKTSTPDKAS